MRFSVWSGTRKQLSSVKNGDRDGREPKHSVAELAVVVIAPAIHRPRARERAGVLRSRLNRRKRQTAGHGDRHVGRVSAGADAELADVVVPPAIRRAARDRKSTRLNS